MTDKHTPAPWVRDDGMIKNPYIKANVCVPCVGHYEITEEQRANAHLIASAPDMLKALETVAQELEDVAEVPQCVYDAIKKARGLK